MRLNFIFAYKIKTSRDKFKMWTLNHKCFFLDGDNSTDVYNEDLSVVTRKEACKLFLSHLKLVAKYSKLKNALRDKDFLKTIRKELFKINESLYIIDQQEDIEFRSAGSTRCCFVKFTLPSGHIFQHLFSLRKL